MKKIDLPLTFTTSFKLDPSIAGKVLVPTPDGRLVCHEGDIDVLKAKDEINQARENAAQVIWFAIIVEQKMNDVIADFFFGRTFGKPNPKRSFFSNHVLNTNSLNFAQKTNIFKKTVTELRCLSGQDYTILEKLLKELMQKRNAFAHGEMISDTRDGIVINYFSGFERRDILTERYWSELEDNCKQLKTLLERISDFLVRKCYAEPNSGISDLLSN